MRNTASGLLRAICSTERWPMIDVYVVSQRAHERLITFEHAFELRFDLVQLLAHQTRRHVDVMV